MSEPIAITELIHRWRNGDRGAQESLINAVYPVMREIAAQRLRRAPIHFTLRTTELAHEAYLRLAGADVDFKDRNHFYAVAARAIRNVVVDHLRAQGAEKRGRDLPFVPLDLAAEEAGEDEIDLRVDWLTVHEALNELEAIDPHSARIVEFKFFCGLTTDEIAVAADISRATVVRDWRFARAWLARRLGAH
jgi:RNA polymerase sigma factor (TIGR02999 family)